ncbi:hypothetical protein HMI56_002534 [Coelomomyces lativittatus]|nr:hypothetical protein HMI56_002534 [Coelomomyces lativittatus]
MEKKSARSSEVVVYRSEMIKSFPFNKWTDFMRLKNLEDDQGVPEYRLRDTRGSSFSIHRLPSSQEGNSKRTGFPEGTQYLAQSKFSKFNLTMNFFASSLNASVFLGTSDFCFLYHGHLILVKPSKSSNWYNRKVAIEGHWLNPDLPDVNGKNVGPSTLVFKHQLENPLLGVSCSKFLTGSVWVNQALIQTLAENPLLHFKKELSSRDIKYDESLCNLDPNDLTVAILLITSAMRNSYAQVLSLITIIGVATISSVVLLVLTLVI